MQQTKFHVSILITVSVNKLARNQSNTKVAKIKIWCNSPSILRTDQPTTDPDEPGQST